MARKPKTVIGWEEWCAFPELGLPAVKAKIDTGAKTSALHAYDIEPFSKSGENFVAFKIHPLQRNQKLEIQCYAPLKDKRNVTSSNGEKEMRYVIEAKIEIGGAAFVTEITLTSRHKMSFRMLLGRDALRKGKFVVDPVKSYVLGKIKGPEKLYTTSNKSNEYENSRTGIGPRSVF